MRGQQYALAALYPVKDPVPILQEAEWAPRPVWMGGKSCPHRDLIPVHSAHSQLLYRLSYLAHKCVCIFMKIKEQDIFCGHNILTEGVFLAQLSSHLGISFWRSVWVMINCSFMSNTWLLKPPSTKSVGAEPQWPYINIWFTAFSISNTDCLFSGHNSNRRETHCPENDGSICNIWCWLVCWVGWLILWAMCRICW